MALLSAPASRWVIKFTLGFSSILISYISLITSFDWFCSICFQILLFSPSRWIPLSIAGLLPKISNWSPWLPCDFPQIYLLRSHKSHLSKKKSNKLPKGSPLSPEDEVLAWLPLRGLFLPRLLLLPHWTPASTLVLPSRALSDWGASSPLICLRGVHLFLSLKFSHVSCVSKTESAKCRNLLSVLSYTSCTCLYYYSCHIVCLS